MASNNDLEGTKASGSDRNKEINNENSVASSSNSSVLKRLIDIDSSDNSGEKSESKRESEGTKRQRTTESVEFPTLSERVRKRKYRSQPASEESMSEGNNEVDDMVGEEPPAERGETSEEELVVIPSSSDSEVAGAVPRECNPLVLQKTAPRHKWCSIKQIMDRQLGGRGSFQSPSLFRLRYYGSLHVVERLELMYKMEAHKGCVNSLHFNSAGTKLASGSDDLKVVIWDWSLGKSIASFDTGHRSNIFQAKFMPLCGDTHIITCARDGQIRLAELTSSGSCLSTRKLSQHKGSAHKLSIHPDTPHIFLSAAEDGNVLCGDIREPKASKLISVREKENKVSLYSIHSHPLNPQQFLVSGRDPFVRVYDRSHFYSF